MSKTEQLNVLFAEWRSNSGDQQQQFISDGIINEQLFEQQKPKLLFLTKESNADSGAEWDFRETWKNPNGLRFDRRIAEWAWGIQNSFKPFDEVYRKEELYREAIQKIAFMDVKKTSGGGKCDNGNLLQYIENFQEEIQEQIDIIKPDIIISGLVEISLVSAVFPGLQFIKSGYDRCLAKWKDYIIIDFFHPSGQTPPAAMYCLLEKMYTSEVFKEMNKF